MDTIAERLLAERRRLKLTQLAVAKQINPSAKTAMRVSRWENGAAVPSGQALKALAELGYDTHFVLTGKTLTPRPALLTD